MTPEEFDKIRGGLKAAFPWANIMPDNYSIRLWFEKLKEYPYKIVNIAVNELISTCKQPPSIAEIREKCTEYMTGKELKTADEAWLTVHAAITKYGVDGALEAMKNFDDVTKQAVKSIGYRELCTSESMEVTRAHFLRFYESIKRKTMTQYLLTDDVKQARAKLIKKDEPALTDRKQEEQPKLLGDDERASPEFISELMKKNGWKG